MIIVPINPINLDQTELLEQRTSLKNYFINGPGMQCLEENDSFYIKTL